MHVRVLAFLRRRTKFAWYLMKRNIGMTGSLETVLLTLPQGQINGCKRRTVYDETYISFEGIPFAKPPVGELRFKAPQPADPWTGILDCTNSPNKPVQKNFRAGTIEGSEDCLYLNVFAKTLKSEKPLPVMVWIYGGGFQTGKSCREHHGPDYLMREDIVFVSFNYRLCSLGFLSLSDPSLEVPGNAALKDQVLALKWIKEHIGCFNGDSNNITLFGESAGGASAHYMMATERTKGLFNKAILMSGCVLNYWAQMQQTDMAFRLAKYHGYEGENVDKEVLAYLRQLEPDKLVDHALLTPVEQKHFIWLTFGPIVEPYLSEDCVVPKEPLEMLKTTWSNHIPIMLGGVSFEGLVMYPRVKNYPNAVKLCKKNPECLIPHEVRACHTEEELREMGEKLIKFYFNEKLEQKEEILQFLHMCSHKMFWHGLHRTALSRVTYAPQSSTFLYRFDFDSPYFNHHRIRFCGDDIKSGVAHADDLSYLFFIMESKILPIESEEFKTIQRMVGIWTSFAKVSDPNCKEIEPNVWNPLTASSPATILNISNDIDISELPEKSALDIWDNLYQKVDLC